MDDSRRCRATNRRGERCRRAAARGAVVCASHGAKAPQVKAKAAERVARAEIAQAVRTFGLNRAGVSEEEALRQELGRTLGHIAWLEVLVANLEPADLFWGRVAEQTGRESGSGTGGDTTRDHAMIRREARVSVPLAHLLEERKHLKSLAVEMVRLGLQEREVRIEEQQGHLWASVMRAVLGDEALGLSAAQLEVAPEIVSRHLRLLALHRGA
jgi:hypothetical protein